MELTGGGNSTVTSDGVTIQGVGSVASPIAIKAVQHDATLTGNGTVASPLAVAAATPAGWPVTWWNFDASGTVGSVTFSTVNRLRLAGFSIPASIQYSKIWLVITAGDAVNLYNAGIYTYAGALVSQATPGSIAGTGAQSFAQASGPFTINPGRYFLALTCTVATATYASGNTANGMIRYFNGGNTIVTAGAVMTGPITPPADSVTSNTAPVFALST
jgi:hypothetical protein